MQTKSDYESWHKSMASVEADEPIPLYPWHRTVLKLLPDLNGKLVLEVGCGRGDFARALGKRYPSVKLFGTDFSTTAIGTAKSKVPLDSNVRFEVADAQNLPFENNYFDYIISCECLEHVEIPSEMMSNVARCLKPGGGFIVTTENYANGMILAWIKSWLTGEPFNSGSGVQPRENFFLFWKVRRLIEGAGLEVTHMESNHFQWLLLPRVSPERLCTKDFKSALWKGICRPFGRHFTFVGIKPEAV
jgi:SAM-dependent methyltransferase